MPIACVTATKAGAVGIVGHVGNGDVVIFLLASGGTDMHFANEEPLFRRSAHHDGIRTFIYRAFATRCSGARRWNGCRTSQFDFQFEMLVRMNTGPGDWAFCGGTDPRRTAFCGRGGRRILAGHAVRAIPMFLEPMRQQDANQCAVFVSGELAAKRVGLLRELQRSVGQSQSISITEAASGISTPPTSIPLPSASWACLWTLGGLGASGLIKRMRRAIA